MSAAIYARKSTAMNKPRALIVLLAMLPVPGESRHRRLPAKSLAVSVRFARVHVGHHRIRP